MDDTAVDAVLVPADTHQEIMVAFSVKDELTLDFAVGVGYFAYSVSTRSMIVG